MGATVTRTPAGHIIQKREVETGRQALCTVAELSGGQRPQCRATAPRRRRRGRALAGIQIPALQTPPPPRPFQALTRTVSRRVTILSVARHSHGPGARGPLAGRPGPVPTGPGLVRNFRRRT